LATTTSPQRGLLKGFVSPRRERSTEIEVFGMGAEDMKLLTSRIKQATNWKDLQAALAMAREHEHELDCIALTACFSSLPRVLKRYSKLQAQERAEVASAVDWLTAQLRPRLSSWDSVGLVGAAVGLAKLDSYGLMEQRDPAQLRCLLQDIAAASVVHMKSGDISPQGLSNLAWALAVAGVRPSGAWLSEFWHELEEQLEHLNAKDVAHVFWSICRLEIMPPWVSDGSMPSMIGHAMKCVGTAETGQDPATVLVCLAIWHRSFSYHAPAAEVTRMLSNMQPRLGNYMPQDLVSIVHSLVVMNFTPGRAWMTDFYMVLRNRLVSEPTLSYSDFQRLLWALSRIDYVPSRAWLAQFVEISSGKLSHLRNSALSEIVWALACWQYTPGKKWLQEYFRVTMPKLAEFKPTHLANTILALKKLNCKVPTLWLDSALCSFCAQLHDARAHDLVTFVDGIVDVCEDAAWMSRPATGQRLCSLADFAASKFEICDCVMHAKLLVALATAKCCPGTGWLAQHQASLTKSLASASSMDDEDLDLDSATAMELRNAYASMDVPLSPSLEQELMLRSL